MPSNPPKQTDASFLGVALRAETLDAKTRSVETVITSETPILARDLRSWDIIDEVLMVDGFQGVDQVPILDSHDRSSITKVLGSVREIRREGNQIVGRLFFAENPNKTQLGELADRAWELVEQGHQKDTSVRAPWTAFVDLEKGTTATVNGRSFTAGVRNLRVITEWTIREVSVLPVGADQHARIRAEMGMVPQEERNKTMNKELQKFLEHLGLKAEATRAEAGEFYLTMGSEVRERAKAVFDGEVTADQQIAAMSTRGDKDDDAPPADPPQETLRGDPPAKNAPQDAAAIAQEALRADRERRAAIRKLGGEDIPEDLVERACEDGSTVEEAKGAFLTAIRADRQAPVGGSFSIHSRSHDVDCTERSLAAGLMMRSGNIIELGDNATEVQRSEWEQDMDRGQRYSDMAMIDICREALRMAGQTIPVGREETIRAAVSTVALSNVFSNVVGKRFMQAFEQAIDSTLGWTDEIDVPDFKTQTLVRLGKMAGLDVLPRGGQADHADIEDQAESFKILRFAKQFGVDEQDIIDDNMMAFSRIPRHMGAAAARLRPDSVFWVLLNNAALADSVALFHATHRNLGTAALAAAGLQAGITAMGNQYELKGKEKIPLNVQTRHLIVPNDLDFTADILLNSADRRDDTLTANGTRNPLKQRGIQLHTDSRLGVNGVVDPITKEKKVGTATNWFLAADASIAPAILVAYLAGRGRRPRLRNFVMNQGRWGIGWDIAHEIAAVAEAFEGLYKSTGAA